MRAVACLSHRFTYYAQHCRALNLDLSSLHGILLAGQDCTFLGMDMERCQLSVVNNVSSSTRPSNKERAASRGRHELPHKHTCQAASAPPLPSSKNVLGGAAHRIPAGKAISLLCSTLLQRRGRLQGGACSP